MFVDEANGLASLTLRRGVALRRLLLALGSSCAAVLILLSHGLRAIEPLPVSLEEQLAAEPAAKLAALARTEGDPRRGALLFHQPHMACIRCHTTGGAESPLGPDLARLPADVTAEHLVESVLAPSKQIRRGFEATVLQLDDGTAMTGFVVQESAETIVIRDAGQSGRRRTVPKESIEQREVASLSVMPTGQVNLLEGRQQFLDLMAYLIEIAEQGPDRAHQLRPAGAPLGPPPAAPDTTGSRPQVYRTLMPESGPASLAIGLGRGVWLCFDPQRGGINYAWTGGLDLSPTVAQKINQPATIDGSLFFIDATPTPLRITGDSTPPEVQFLSYRLNDDGVTLRYRFGDIRVTERLTPLPSADGFERRCQFSGAAGPLTWQIDRQAAASVVLNTGRRLENGWEIDLRQTPSATMRVKKLGVHQ